MAEAGYRLGELPPDSAALMARLLAGPTNSGRHRHGGEKLSLAAYEDFLSRLPSRAREQVEARWGRPESDPFSSPGASSCRSIASANRRRGPAGARLQHRSGRAAITIPDLVPPHGYLAFYAWLREDFDAHAIVHIGKHGNLEWLPGKALALSAECWPEAVLGPLPHLYPFIVNDPGEGSQAKRRAARGDHRSSDAAADPRRDLRPAADLERLVDEYYEAAGLDPRRCNLLRQQILELARSSGLDKDCGIAAAEEAERCAGQARRPSLRAEGAADPRRAACLRQIARGRAADRSAGGAHPPAARRRAGPAMPR